MPYLHFPSYDVLYLVLLAQAVPAEVQLSACTGYPGAQGDLYVEPSQKLSHEVTSALDRFDVTVAEQLPTALTTKPPIVASCWQQLLPLERRSVDDSIDAKTVLFRVSSSSKFTALAAEMIRLGNDRISYRHVGESTGPARLFGRRSSAKVAYTLLRVNEPPYYTLVDVLEAESVRDVDDRAFAYREQAPRVWVRMGYEHPMASRIEPPAGHFLLIDPPHDFHWVKEAAFHDIYQAMDVRMPESVHAWQPLELDTRLPIALTLTTSPSTSASAEMWIVHTNAMQQLEQLVAHSGDELIDRLSFAVITKDGDQPTVALRVRPSRAAPPILILDATAYCTTMRLSNLFLPVGTRLQPPLRRDAVAKLLASDNRLLTWLELDAARDPARRFWPFQTHTIADSAFRPLRDWVEYVLDHQATSLDTWVASHRFQFESFVCQSDRREPHQPAPAPATDAGPTAKTKSGSATVKQGGAAKEAEQPKAQVEQLKPEPSPKRTTTNETIEQLKRVEADFLKANESLDSPTRIPAWHRLATLNTELKHRTDATICWSNLLWYTGHVTAERTQEWLQAEMDNSGRAKVDIQTLRSLIIQPDSRGREASLVAAYVIHAVASRQGTNELRAMSAELTNYFERQRNFLPVRLVWLTALAMHELVGSDPLGLARVRDQTLERLYENGLNSEFDIVSFLRGSGQHQSERHRSLRGRWQDLLTTVTNWLSEPIVSGNQTRNYVKFLFAYALVRIGEVINGRDLLHQATNDTDHKDIVHLWMALAFNHRVEQAAQGGNNREPLPEDLIVRLESMDRLDRYKIDRMRQYSRVLEPHVRIDPYRRWHRRYTDELFQTLAELKDLLDLKKVEARLRSLLKAQPTGPRGLRVLATALEFAPRLGDEFSTQLLDRVDKLLAECSDVIEKSLLLHRSLYVAAHFGHTSRVNGLIACLRDELPAIVDSYLQLDSQYNPVDKERIETVETLLQHSFREMRKLGMREELSALYKRIAELVEEHSVRAARALRKRPTESDASLSRRLSLLLCVASGYYFFGNGEEGDQLADRVRNVLVDGQLVAVEQRRVACAYVHCVSLGDPEASLERIFQLFKRRPNGERVLPKIEDTMTTSSHFSVSEIEFIEASLLSLLSDESSWDPRCQLWLDQDEFAVRKKIHADMRDALR